MGKAENGRTCFPIASRDLDKLQTEKGAVCHPVDAIALATPKRRSNSTVSNFLHRVVESVRASGRRRLSRSPLNACAKEPDSTSTPPFSPWSSYISFPPDDSIDCCTDCTGSLESSGEIKFELGEDVATRSPSPSHFELTVRSTRRTSVMGNDAVVNQESTAVHHASLELDSSSLQQHHFQRNSTEKRVMEGRSVGGGDMMDYIDGSKNGSEERSVIPNANQNGNYVDGEGVHVRKIKLMSNQNVGFESLPVQFVNKATKAGFVFNVLIVGETGVGKSTLINSLFNHDFKLQPADYSYETVQLDKQTFQLEEGSVKLQLTIIETKGYGDQINMIDSCRGIADYIDQQYEAYFQEESKVNRRLADYKDTRVHVCIFLLAPTGSTVRALDLECMKILGDKVNIIPVIARGDSLTKQEKENFKRRIVEELRSHNINIYRFPEDDAQVADLNRRLNADIPFAVVGSSEVHDVAGHKTRARLYPWGVVDIENESHCDFTRFREALLRVNMDNLMQTTHLRHYELYRDGRMQQLGYDSKENSIDFMETIGRLRSSNEQEYRKKEEETKASFVVKVRAKESELKERERQLHAQYDQRRQETSEESNKLEHMASLVRQETDIFNRIKNELMMGNGASGTIKTKKK